MYQRRGTSPTRAILTCGSSLLPFTNGLNSRSHALLSIGIVKIFIYTISPFYPFHLIIQQSRYRPLDADHIQLSPTTQSLFISVFLKPSRYCSFFSQHLRLDIQLEYVQQHLEPQSGSKWQWFLLS